MEQRIQGLRAFIYFGLLYLFIIGLAYVVMIRKAYPRIERTVTKRVVAENFMNDLKRPTNNEYEHHVFYYEVSETNYVYSEGLFLKDSLVSRDTLLKLHICR